MFLGENEPESSGYRPEKPINDWNRLFIDRKNGNSVDSKRDSVVMRGIRSKRRNFFAESRIFLLKGARPLKKSILHAKLESLNRRLLVPSAEVKSQLAKSKAGLEGEKRLFYFLSEIEKPVRILHDIRLPFPSGYTHFQMDFLVITPALMFIFEVKHLQGHLVFNQNTRQLLRGDQAFPDPIAQVLRHKLGLEVWLEQPIPVVPAVVLTHPNVRVDFSPENAPVSEMVFYASELPAKIDEFLQNKPSLLNDTDIRRFAQKLQQHHHPYDPDILTKFEIQPEQIRRGIQCPECSSWSVQKQTRIWICKSCQVKLKNPHLSAMKDWVRLFGPSITNQQFRWFTGVESETSAKKTLQKWSVSSTGKTKSTVYKFPEQWKWE